MRGTEPFAAQRLCLNHHCGMRSTRKTIGVSSARLLCNSGDLEESIKSWLAQPRSALLDVKVNPMQLVAARALHGAGGPDRDGGLQRRGSTGG
jgi:hypothetical protein